MFEDGDTPLGVMNAEKWRRTIEFHADAYGSSPDVDPGTVFAGQVATDEGTSAWTAAPSSIGVPLG